jgi:hypothetical protein
VSLWLRIRSVLAEGALAAAAVVGASDPAHDRDAELFADVPAAGVQDVALRQATERLHGGDVTTGTDSAH